MNKTEIFDKYAIEQGYESWEHLIISTIQYYGYKDATNHITTLFNAVTDLIQEELLKKASKQLILGQTLNKAQQVILNTEIL